MNSYAEIYRYGLEVIANSKGKIKSAIPPADIDINEMSSVASKLFERKSFVLAGKVDKALFDWIENTTNA